MSNNEFICDCNVIHKDVVEDVSKMMLSDDLFYKIADFFKILGDTTRMKILFALDKKEMCVCDIAEAQKQKGFPQFWRDWRVCCIAETGKTSRFPQVT